MGKDGKKNTSNRSATCLAALTCLVSCFASSHIPKESSRQLKASHPLKPPEVLKRRRALSISADTVADTVHQNQSLIVQTQAKGPLLCLPLELRLLIYELVIGDESIHIIWRDGKLHSYRCFARQVGWHELCGDDYAPYYHCWRGDQGNRLLQPSKIEVLPLLQTCRTIYSEMAPILYRKPTFIFHNWTSLLVFTGSILPQRFNSITSVHIDASRMVTFESWICEYAFNTLGYSVLSGMHAFNQLPAYSEEDKATFWTAVCDMLEKMQGLKRLQMDLSMYALGRENKRVLQPLIDIGKKKNFKSFEVEIDWKKSEDWDVGDDCPFVLRRFPKEYRQPTCTFNAFWLL